MEDWFQPKYELAEKASARVVSAFRLGVDSITKPKGFDGFFGISCSYPFFSKDSVENYCDSYYKHKEIDKFIKFGKNQFRNFIVFLFDVPLYYNLMAFAGMSENVAINYSKYIGDIMKNKLENEIDKSKIIRWDDINNNDRFIEILDAITKQSMINKKFKQGCIDLTINGTRNKLLIIKKRYGTGQYKKALSIAQRYAFLDVATDLFLIERFSIGLSKYEAPLIIKELYNGLYPDLKRELKLSEGGYLQLSFSNKSYVKSYDDQFEEG